MKKFLVTGGAGFIGSHLVERLVEQGHAVRVIDDFSTGRRENLAAAIGRIELIEGDLLDKALCRQAVDGIDCVFHEAAIPSVARSVEDPVGTMRTNVMGTAQLLSACVEARVRRFVFAGSSSAYGDQAVEVKDETLLPQPLSPYAAAKLAGEQLCQAFAQSYGLSTVALRYFNIFGPRQDPGSPYSAVIPLFIRAALQGRPPVIYGDGLQSRDFTYIGNVVEANLLAAEAEDLRGQVLNIACGRAYTLLDLLQALRSITGVKIEPRFEPARAGDVRHSLASINRARECIGYTPAVGFEEGLRQTVASFQQEL